MVVVESVVLYVLPRVENTLEARKIEYACPYPFVECDTIAYLSTVYQFNNTRCKEVKNEPPRAFEVSIEM
nr:hypothetical protein HmN_000853600 [Hymenolepis microstoma]